MLPNPRRICACAILGTLAASLLSAETFRNPYRIPTPVDPATIAAADINGDGIADIVWGDTSTSPATFHVLLSQPAGGYLPGPDIAFPLVTTRTPECVFTDLNNDGKQDLVCVGAVETTTVVEVWPGNGDGTFQPPIATTLPTSTNGEYALPEVAAIGDLNRDGFRDLLVNDLESNRITLLLGDGKGSFQTPIVQQINFINQVLPVAADVNGDGILDLLSPDGPQVALGNGDGTFQPTVSYAETSFYAAECVFHDMDGDGHLDAVCIYPETITGDITGASDLIILHGNPDGSFNTNPIAHQIFGDHDTEYDGFGTLLTPLAVADANRDGIVDILASSGDGLGVLLGQPGLKYTTPLHYAQAGVGGLETTSFFTSLVLDVNGDGLLDTATVGPSGIYITYGQPDGTFASAFAPEVAEVIAYPTVADFNGDGIPDIVATGDTAIKLSLGKGDGTFAPPTALPRGPANISFYFATSPHILHGDFNGDGKLDLMVIGSTATYLSNLFLLFGHGDGTFDPPLSIPGTSLTYPLYADINDNAVFDINHDGLSDVLSNTGSIQLPGHVINFMLSSGDGSFTNVTTNVPSDVDGNGNLSNITFPALADFRHSGQLDAVYGSITNAYLVKGHGDGTFDTTSVALPVPSLAGAASQGALAVASGDFDGDGNQDFALLEQYSTGTQVLFVHPNATAAWVFYGNGNGTFSAPVLAGSFDHNYTTIAAADLNRDGLADLVITTGGGSDYNEYAVAVLNAQPSRTFGPEINYTAGTGTSSLAIIDLNNDGFPDLVLGNGDSNIPASSVTVLLNSGNVASVTGTLTSTPDPSAVAQPFTITAVLSPPVSGSLTGNITFSVDGKSIGDVPLSSNAATIAGPTTLSAGVHQLAATWPGDSKYPALTLSATHTVTANPLSLTLTSAPNPSFSGQPVVFTAGFASIPPSTGPFTGTLSFYDSAVLFGQQQPSVAGTAFTTSTLAIGTHYITASYAGDPAFAAATSNVVTQVVDGLPTTTTASVSPNPSTYGQPAIFSTHVAPIAPNKLVPSGKVRFTFCRGAETEVMLDAAGNGSFVSPLPGELSEPVSSCTFTAQYYGDTTFAPSTSAVETYTVTPAPSTTTIVSATPNPAFASQLVSFLVQVAGVPSPTADPVTGQPLPPGTLQLTGTVNLYDGTQLISSGPLTSTASANQATLATSTLSVGSHSITASYTGDPNLLGSVSSPITEIIAPAPTLSLTSNHNPAAAFSPITFTAQLGSSFTGNITLTIGSGQPITLTTDATGLATYTTSALAPGSYLISATYTHSTFVVTALLTQVILAPPPDFTITGPSLITFRTGSTGTAFITLASLNGFAANVAVTCNPPLPTNYLCTLSPSSVPLSANGTSEFKLTLHPDLIAAVRPPPPTGSSRAARIALAALLPLMLLGMSSSKRRNTRTRLRTFFTFTCLVLLTTALTACGPDVYTDATPPGLYPISVTATGTPAGASAPITHTLNFNANLTP